MTASIASMMAHLVDLFGPQASADPTQLYGNLTVSPNGNILIGNITDDGVEKLQVTGAAKITSTLTLGGALGFADASTQSSAAKPLVPVPYTASHTLVLSDASGARSDGWIDMNSASALTLTVPKNATVAFPLGTVINVCQLGAGQVTFAGATGVTLLNSSSLTTRAQYSVVALVQRAIDTWVLAGDVT